MINSSFKHGNETIPMQLGYSLAHGKLFDLGIDVLSIMKEGNTVIPTIMLDDATMLKVWYYYIKEATNQTFEEALEILDENPKGLESFRKAFWEMVVGFSPIAVQDALRSTWKQAEKQLKNAIEKTSTSSSSASQLDSE